MDCRKSFIIAIVALLVLLASLVVSQEVKLLEQNDIEKLSPEAKVLYEKAVSSLDKVDPISAVEYLEQAVKINPEVMRLDCLLADLARKRARLTYADESVKYYNIAEKALELVKEQENINGDILNECASELEIIQKERQAIPERDARRYKFGGDFIAARAKMLLPKEAATPTPTPITPTGALPGTGLETIPALGAPSSSMPSPFVAPSSPSPLPAASGQPPPRGEVLR